MISTEVLMIIAGGLILGGAGFVVCWSAFTTFNQEESLVKQRLKALQAQAQPHEKLRAKKPSVIQQRALAIAQTLSKSLYGNNLVYLNQVKTLLQEAGLSDTDDMLWRFLGLRVLTALCWGALFFVASLVFNLSTLYQVGGLIAGLLLGSRIMEFQLKAKAKKRRVEIRYSLSDTLDLMVVCVEAGLGLDATLQRVGDEVEDLAPELSSELKRVSREMLAGIPRIDAFHNLGERTGVEELKALCALMIQTDKLGTSIADTLRVYSDDVRTRRRLKAEELASKASIKMTFPLVLFIFPPLFIVLMGPVVIQMLGSFLLK